MIEARLLRFARNARGHIAAAVAARWLGLLAGVVVVAAVAGAVAQIADGSATARGLAAKLAVAAAAALARAAFSVAASRASFRASSGVKRLFREKIYGKLLALGGAYTESLLTAEALQVATEGVDQLEVYFASYLPQFFYCAVAPVTLFAAIAPLDMRSALALLLCAPLIPAMLLMIGKMAGKMTRRQWKSYISLGDRFLENLQGMTTLKAYGADGARQGDMAREAEAFRLSTMRILRMQLASVVVMDIVAFGGAAAGVALGALAFARGDVGLSGALAITLLSAEFFIPLRQLGSLFHVSMNGVAASGRMFRLLDMEAPRAGEKTVPGGGLPIELRELSFAYPGADRPAVSGVSLVLDRGLVALVGESGSGKSTVAAILSGGRRGYGGSVLVAGTELRDISAASLAEHVTLVPHDGYVFSGSVAENLRLARPGAPDGELVRALEMARIWDFFAPRGGLGAQVAERGSNLSGGQRQRLCLARALLRGGGAYIFDEAASNIDSESEAAIMGAIRELAETACVLLITHRLANVAGAGRVCLMDRGAVAESGSHAELMALGGKYARLFGEQRELERYAAAGGGQPGAGAAYVGPGVASCQTLEAATAEAAEPGGEASRAPEAAPAGTGAEPGVAACLAPETATVGQGATYAGPGAATGTEPTDQGGAANRQTPEAATAEAAEPGGEASRAPEAAPAGTGAEPGVVACLAPETATVGQSATYAGPGAATGTEPTDQGGAASRQTPEAATAEAAEPGGERTGGLAATGAEPALENGGETE
ncbi:MAG: ATP-binding cassette domain-containing protein [Clostridiales bacterium]|jgi:ABC-type transport system involved in cytochrome bd biosynthesis fused ATPase/permease subunit|nr:ATP-binding cassette domain-containing protein [Clostridiales bacterium]